MPSPIGSVQNLRTGGRWFDLWLGQYSVFGLTTVIATGFIPLSLLPIVSTVVTWLGYNIVRVGGKKNSMIARLVALAAGITEIMLKTAFNTMQSISDK